MEDTEQRSPGIENGPEWSNGTVHFDRTGPTKKSGPPRKVDFFSKLFQTDPFSLRPKFPENLVEWIAPVECAIVYFSGVSHDVILNSCLLERVGMNFLVYHWTTSQKKVLLLTRWHLFLVVIIERLRRLKKRPLCTKLKWKWAKIHGTIAIFIHFHGKISVNLSAF